MSNFDRPEENEKEGVSYMSSTLQTVSFPILLIHNIKSLMIRTQVWQVFTLSML